MKADYNGLIYAYESFECDILDIIAGDLIVATEAETPYEMKGSNATADTVSSDETKGMKKLGLVDKVVATVKKLLKKIGAMLDQLKLKIKNKIRMLNESDKGFQRTYYKQKSLVKPRNVIKVITYQYKNSELDSPVNKMMGEINKCFEKLSLQSNQQSSSDRINQIIGAPQGKMVSVLLEPYINGNTEIDNMPMYIKYLIGRFRGEKKELTFSVNQVQNIEALALSTNRIVDACNGYVRNAQQAYTRIKTIEYHIKRSSNDEKIIRAAANNVARASILYNAYSALIQAYYEIKLEQCLNYRVLLKRFYQF